MRRNYRELQKRRIYRAFSKDLTRSILNLDFHFKERKKLLQSRERERKRERSEQSIGALGDVSKLPRGISSFSYSDPFSSFSVSFRGLDRCSVTKCSHFINSSPSYRQHCQSSAFRKIPPKNFSSLLFNEPLENYFCLCEERKFFRKK
jgi:hypothetical protein